MIEARDLTKAYAGKVAVDHLSFTVQPGRVTGFLGPNGAGKSTTMRLILGLDRPDGGAATIDGKRYAELVNPLRTVGALLEAKSVHSGRSAANHLLFLAQSQGLPKNRVGEVLDLVGLSDVAGKRAGTFSLGMSQRLGIAAAMLGDPAVLLLDEPVNGLDPEGVLWIRNLMKYLAGQGRTILVSSHLMNEMAVTADHLIVIGRGRLIAASSTAEVIARSSEQSVRVRTPDPARLAALIEAEGGRVSSGAAPAAPGPAAPGPGTADPGTAGPGAARPGAFDPDAVNAGASSPGAFNAGTLSPGAFNPGAFHPDAFSDGGFDAGAFSPGAANPGAANPGAGVSGATVSDSTDSGWDSASTLTVTGMPAPRIGELAASASIVLHELSPQLASLEEAFMELTADSLEFGTHNAGAPATADRSAR